VSDRKMFLSHRAAIMSHDIWPWQCIDAAFVPGNRPGFTDNVIFHWWARYWPAPLEVTPETLDAHNIRVRKGFRPEIVSLDDVATKELAFRCPCCQTAQRKGMLECLTCQGVFLFPVPPWMKSLVPPSVRSQRSRNRCCQRA